MNTDRVLFTANKEEFETTAKIVERLYKDHPNLARLNFLMDLDACHSNGCKLDFNKLLDFPDSDFLHDCHGIIDNIDRHSGKLKNFFLPRCSLK